MADVVDVGLRKETLGPLSEIAEGWLIEMRRSGRYAPLALVHSEEGNITAKGAPTAHKRIFSGVLGGETSWTEKESVNRQMRADLSLEVVTKVTRT